MNSLQHSQPSPGSSSSSSMRLAFTPDGIAIYNSVMAAASVAAPTYQGGGGGGGGCGDNNNNSAAGGGGGGGGSNINMMNIGGEPMKRKRGRPRKYGPDGTMALGLTPTVDQTPVPVPPPIQIPTVVIGGGGGGGGFSPSSGGGEAGAGGVSPSSSSMKKARGRPPGSGKKQQQQQQQMDDALGGSGGIGFTPHVIAVKAGEDISSKIMSFSQHGPWAVCILSANGAISNVTLRQAATSGGTVTYEGRFEILSLTGSFLLCESGGQRSRTGGLSVSLAGPDGRVLGGGVAGILTAASPVQVVVGSFIVDGALKETKLSPLEPCSSAPLAPSKVTAGGGVAGGASSPTSRGTMSESSGGPGSPLNQSTGACNNNSNNNMQGMANMPWK